MSTAVCKKCKKYVRFRKTQGVKLAVLLANYRCPCGGELEDYRYHRHGYIRPDSEYAGEAVMV